MTVVLRDQPQADRALQGALVWSQAHGFTGHVFDPARLEQKFTVELLVDGFVVGCAVAHDAVDTLAEQGIGDGCYGFGFRLQAGILDDARIVEARLANLGDAVGQPIRVSAGDEHRAEAASPGAVRWLGGLRFAGWVADGAPVSIKVDGEQVAEVRADGWTHVATPHPQAVRAFDLQLPERFSDGGAHRLTAENSRGIVLAGAPLPFMAFSRGLAAVTVGDGDRLRAELFDRLMPMSIPFADYERWRELVPPWPAADVLPSAAVFVVGTGDAEATLESLHAQSHPEWVTAVHGEPGGATGFDNAALREFLAGDGEAADFVVFLPAGATLAPSALARFAAEFSRRPGALALYGDLEVSGADGTSWPLALPAFDHERLLEQGYCSLVFALRREAARRAAAEGAANLFRLFNAMLDGGPIPAEAVIHLPGAAAALPALDLDDLAQELAAATTDHLHRRGLRAEAVPGTGQVLPAVRVMRDVPDGRVSIVIPTRNRGDLLRTCLQSILPAASARAAEIIVVDNDSSEPSTLDYLAAIDGREARVLRVPGAFNFARLNNLAAVEARGSYLCLLNNDVRARDSDWLDEMLGRIADPDTGAVGARLLWPSGVVQHGGIVLGPNFSAAHAGNDRMDGDAGYADQMLVARECSALTAACLLTRRQDYINLGGMDQHRFPVNYNDVDYCLKLRAAGKRVVFTPHASLVHLESASRGSDSAPDRKARYQRELDALRAKWGDTLAADPFYSPLLSLDHVPHSALAWPLRTMSARTSAPLQARSVPSGF